jgi:hypothetical protein
LSLFSMDLGLEIPHGQLIELKMWGVGWTIESRVNW